MHPNPFSKLDRPPSVVFISLFIFFSIGFALLSFCLALAGFVPAQAQQEAHFESLSSFDSGLTFLALLAVFTGGIALFLLRRIALYFFISGLVISFIKLFWRAFGESWFTGVINSAIIEQPRIAWGALLVGLLAVCVYAWKLTRSGILT